MPWLKLNVLVELVATPPVYPLRAITLHCLHHKNALEVSYFNPVEVVQLIYLSDGH